MTTITTDIPSERFEIVNCRTVRWAVSVAGKSCQVGFQGRGFCTLLDGQAVTFGNDGTPCCLGSKKNVKEMLKDGLTAGFTVMDVVRV